MKKKELSPLPVVIYNAAEIDNNEMNDVLSTLPLNASVVRTNDFISIYL